MFKVARRQGRRRKKLLDDLKDRRGYCELKEEALDRTVWRHRFARGFGPVVWQITDDDDKINVMHFVQPGPPSGRVPVCSYKVHISHRKKKFLCVDFENHELVSVNSITHSNINNALSCKGTSLNDKTTSFLGNRFVPTFIGFVSYSLCTLNVFVHFVIFGLFLPVEHRLHSTG